MTIIDLLSICPALWISLSLLHIKVSGGNSLRLSDAHSGIRPLEINHAVVSFRKNQPPKKVVACWLEWAINKVLKSKGCLRQSFLSLILQLRPYWLKYQAICLPYRSLNSPLGHLIWGLETVAARGQAPDPFSLWIWLSTCKPWLFY